MSSATDPYQPLEAKVELTRKLVEIGCEVHILIRPQAKLWRLEGIEDKLHIHDLHRHQNIPPCASSSVRRCAA